jgi:predicted Zn-dependent protease
MYENMMSGKKQIGFIVKFDFESWTIISLIDALTHELGHTLGLSHSLMELLTN